MASLQRNVMEISSVQKINFTDTSYLACQEADILIKEGVFYLVSSVSMTDFDVLNTQTRKKVTFKFADWSVLGFDVLSNEKREEAFKSIIIGFALDRLAIDACIDFTVKLRNGIIDNSKLLSL